MVAGSRIPAWRTFKRIEKLPPTPTTFHPDVEDLKNSVWILDCLLRTFLIIVQRATAAQRTSGLSMTVVLIVSVLSLVISGHYEKRKVLSH